MQPIPLVFMVLTVDYAYHESMIEHEHFVPLYQLHNIGSEEIFSGQ